MEDLLDRFLEQLETSLSPRFPHYIFKVSQVKGYFFVLVKNPGEKNLNGDLKYLCDNVQLISENIYKKHDSYSKEFFMVFSLILSV